MTIAPLIIHPDNGLPEKERFSFVSLAKFAEQASMDKDPSDPANNIFSLKEEITAAKYSFSFFLQHMDKLQRQFVKRMEESVVNPSDPPEIVKQKHSAARSAESIHNSLMGLSAEILELSNKVARVVKQGIEVEAAKATRFDGVQMLFILQQIPPLLEALYSATTEALISEIRSDIIEYVPAEYCTRLFQHSKILNSNPTIAIQALDSTCNVLINNFNKQLEQLKVAYARNSSQARFLEGGENFEQEEGVQSVSSGELGELVSSLIVSERSES